MTWTEVAALLLAAVVVALVALLWPQRPGPAGDADADDPYAEWRGDDPGVGG